MYAYYTIQLFSFIKDTLAFLMQPIAIERDKFNMGIMHKLFGYFNLHISNNKWKWIKGHWPEVTMKAFGGGGQVWMHRFENV